MVSSFRIAVYMSQTALLALAPYFQHLAQQDLANAYLHSALRRLLHGNRSSHGYPQPN